MVNKYSKMGHAPSTMLINNTTTKLQPAASTTTTTTMRQQQQQQQHKTTSSSKRRNSFIQCNLLHNNDTLLSAPQTPLPIFSKRKKKKEKNPTTTLLVSYSSLTLSHASKSIGEEDTLHSLSSTLSHSSIHCFFENYQNRRAARRINNTFLKKQDILLNNINNHMSKYDQIVKNTNDTQDLMEQNNKQLIKKNKSKIPLSNEKQQKQNSKQPPPAGAAATTMTATTNNISVKKKSKKNKEEDKLIKNKDFIKNKPIYDDAGDNNKVNQQQQQQQQQKLHHHHHQHQHHQSTSRKKSKKKKCKEKSKTSSLTLYLAEEEVCTDDQVDSLTLAEWPVNNTKTTTKIKKKKDYSINNVQKQIKNSNTNKNGQQRNAKEINCHKEKVNVEQMINLIVKPTTTTSTKIKQQQQQQQQQHKEIPKTIIPTSTTLLNNVKAFKPATNHNKDIPNINAKERILSSLNSYEKTTTTSLKRQQEHKQYHSHQHNNQLSTQTISGQVFVRDGNSLLEVIKDSNDRRLTSACDRFGCNVEIFEERIVHGSKQYPMMIHAPNVTAMMCCVRLLDTRFNWNLTGQLLHHETSNK